MQTSLATVRGRSVPAPLSTNGTCSIPALCCLASYHYILAKVTYADSPTLSIALYKAATHNPIVAETIINTVLLTLHSEIISLVLRPIFL